MINLFFVIHDYSGARTYADELLGYFIREEAEVSIHKIYLESTYHKEYTTVEENGILEIHIPPVKRKGYSLEKYAKRCIDLMEPVMANKRNPIFHLNYPTQVKFGVEVKKKFGGVLIYTAHYLPEIFSIVKLYPNIKENLNNINAVDVLDREVIKLADNIICISKFARDTICKHFRMPVEKTALIYNGYGTVESKQADNKAMIRKSFGFGENDRLILFAGKLDVEKGVPDLIEVFKKILMEFSDVRLVLAGEGDFKEIMELCWDIAGKVTFTGFLKKEQLQKLYNIANMGVIPSHWELFGYVPVEMMRYRVPVIISNVPGMNELIEDGKNGLVCKVRKKTNGKLGVKVDEADLYIKIKTLLKDETLAGHFAQNGRLTWEINYTAGHMGKETLNLYKQTLKQNFVPTLRATS